MRRAWWGGGHGLWEGLKQQGGEKSIHWRLEECHIPRPCQSLSREVRASKRGSGREPEPAEGGGFCEQQWGLLRGGSWSLRGVRRAPMHEGEAGEHGARCQSSSDVRRASVWGFQQGRLGVR